MSKEGVEIKKIRSVKVEDSLWNAAKEKAGMVPLSAVIRELLRKWANGEIELNEGE